MIQAYDLGQVAKQYGFVPRETALALQRESQLLLLLTWKDENEKGIYTSKVFDYLAARRPILAIGQTGSVVDDLLRETKTGQSVDDYDLLSLQSILIRAYHSYRITGMVPYEGEEHVIMHYSHFEMARQFSEIFNRVIS